eukprot:g2802.t1
MTQASELKCVCERLLSSAVDDDTCEYIASLLSDEDTDIGNLGSTEIAALVAPLLDGDLELANTLAHAVATLYLDTPADSASNRAAEPPPPPGRPQSSTCLLPRAVLLGSSSAGGDMREPAETETETRSRAPPSTEKCATAAPCPLAGSSAVASPAHCTTGAAGTRGRRRTKGKMRGGKSAPGVPDQERDTENAGPSAAALGTLFARVLHEEDGLCGWGTGVLDGTGGVAALEALFSEELEGWLSSAADDELKRIDWLQSGAAVLWDKAGVTRETLRDAGAPAALIEELEMALVPELEALVNAVRSDRRRCPVPGMACSALLHEDGEWHLALVLDVDAGTKMIRVAFEEWKGKEQECAWDEVAIVESMGDEEKEGDDCERGICALCGRRMPISRHHLIPRKAHRRIRKRRGLTTEQLNRTTPLCRPCHSAVHRAESNDSLADKYNTIEALRAHPKIASFARYASGQKAATEDRWAEGMQYKR